MPNNLEGIPNLIFNNNLNATTLGDILNKHSVLSIKSYGQGSLSTASFRGMLSSHTKVSWKGLDINPPHLGSFDFSLIPSFFTDQVYLKSGNASLGSIGGEIAIDSKFNLNNFSSSTDLFSTKLFTEYGSNNTLSTGVHLTVIHNQFFAITKLFYSHSDNDFLFLNKVAQKESFYEHRKNSSYLNLGAMQEIGYKITNSSLISLSLWYSENQRELPQPIVVYKSLNETQKSNTLRSILEYSYKNNGIELTSSIGYTYDRLNFTSYFPNDTSKIIPDINSSHKIFLQSSFSKEVANNNLSVLNLTGSIKTSLDIVKSDNYASKSVKRISYSAKLGIKYKYYNKFFFNIDGAINGSDKLFSPLLGIFYKWSILDNDLLSLRGNFTNSFRIPTLNDLFWNPGGNKDLKPERGVTSDITLNLYKRWGAFTLSSTATFYAMLVKDWIMWIPGASYYWSPINVKKVLSYGTELNITLFLNTNEVSQSLTLISTYSPSKDIYKGGLDNNTYNKQLPYVPLHKWSLNYNITFYNIVIGYNLNYSGLRYTTSDNSYSTDAYLLHDLEISYKLVLKYKNRVKLLNDRCSITAKFSIDNVANTYYENTQYYPMPLRMFNGTLLFEF